MARDVLNDKKRTIGETIKHLRQEKLWTQVELANRLETTTTSVGRWENNITRPSLHFQQQLCDLFGKTPEELGFLHKTESAQESRPDETQEKKNRIKRRSRARPKERSSPKRREAMLPSHYLFSPQ